MAAHDDRPFVHKISPDVGINSPGSLPLIVIRRIYQIMEKDDRGDLSQRYDKAFKIAIDRMVTERLIKIFNGAVLLDTIGVPKEVEARTTKPDTRAMVIRFTQWMETIVRDRARKAGEQ